MLSLTLDFTMQLTIFNFFLYIVLTWGSNIALNFLYVLKRYIPVFIKYDRPLDMGLMFQNNRLIGESTTILGLLISFTLSILFFILFEYIWLGYIPILVYIGHTVGSFIKRRLGKSDGTFVIFLDHGDYMIITGLVLYSLGFISWQLALSGLLFTYIFHPIACLIAFHLKMRQNPY